MAYRFTTPARARLRASQMRVAVNQPYLRQDTARQPAFHVAVLPALKISIALSLILILFPGHSFWHRILLNPTPSFTTSTIVSGNA